MNRIGRHVWMVVAATAALGAVSAAAQGLAEVARQEEARRKAVTTPAKLYTNRTLKADPSAPVPPGTAAPAQPSPDQPTPDTVGVPAAEPAPPPDPRKTPEHWKTRMAEAIQERDNNALMIEALQSRVNGLWADFTARDNPLERQAVAQNREKALEELARRKTLAETLRKAVADIEDEARRAGVPPGWLR